MSEETNKENPTLSHQGDHHYAKVTYDQEKGRVNAGVISNFSNHASAGLQFVGGKLQGTIVHSGDTHSLQLDVKGNGSFEGGYVDTKDNVEIVFKGGVAELVKGKLPEGGIKVTGDHHIVNISRNGEGKLCGNIESQATDNSAFRINLDAGILSGSYVHKGSSHETAISLSEAGLKAELSFGSGNSKFAMSFEKGKGQVKAFGGIKLKF